MDMDNKKFYCNFFYTEDKPETLVMLKDVNAMPELLLADPDIFVWVGSKKNITIFQDKYMLEKLLNISFYHYETIDQVKKALQYQIHQNATLVIMLDMFEQGQKLNSLQKVKNIFFYSQQMDYQFYGTWEQNIFFNVQQLSKRLKKEKHQNSTPKILPNFVFMAKDIETSHKLVRTMHSLLNQRIDKQTQDKINKEFQKLIQAVGSKFTNGQFEQQKQTFFNALKDGLKTEKQVIQWYTDQTFVYKIVNNLLRAQRHPAEMFYIQPYVKRLFESIYGLYQKQSEQIKGFSQKRELTVYRKGRMNKQQFDRFKQNKGETVQCLGFLSTTKDIKMTQNFSGDTLFEIHVLEKEIGGSQFGFADLQKWKLGRFKQQQILFNPLNTFLIDKVEQSQSGKKINLKYRIFTKYKENQSEKKWRTIAQLQKQQKFQNECQGNALTNQYYHFKEGQKYWDKYLQLVKKIDKKYRNQLDKIKNKSQDEELKISKQCLKFGNSQINVSFQENIKQSISQTSIQRNIEEQIAFNKLKSVYGRWNSIFNSVINQKNELFLSEINDFKFELTNLFGNEHPISLKFLDSLKYSFNYEPPHKKQSRNRFEEIPQKELFEKQPQFMYLKSVTANRFQHHQKQKQSITKKLNLSKSQLNDKTINEIRQFFTGQIEQLSLDSNKLTRIPYFIYEIKNLRKISINNNELRQFKEELQEQQSVKMQQKNNQQNTINENQLNENQRKKIQIKEKLKQHKIQEDKKNCLKQKQQEKGNEIGQIKTEKNQHKVQKQKWINNKLSSLPESIGNLTSLQSLQLQNNKLSSLPECIGNLTSLRSLYLYNNKLSSLPESIGNLTSLRSLNLKNNKLSSLPECFGKLKSLQKLSLQNNQLSSLPESIENLTSLRSLYLKNNKLSILPECFGKLKSLQNLTLQNNQLSSLPESIENLTQLRLLYLQNNKLSSLPESIGYLTSLPSLNLNNNQLSSLPESIENLTQLRLLYLQDNKLSSLPESIGNLTSLRSLYLYNNKLSSLPECIGKLKSLQKLSLQYNQLSSLPESIGKLQSLLKLTLQYNQLQSLPESIVNLTSLPSLNLNNNQLSSFPESIVNLTSLRSLYLKNNKLSSLPECIGNLTSLWSLNLQNNKLSILPECFGKLKSLQKLSLQNNQLSSLPESIGNLTSLQELSLSTNKFISIPKSCLNLLKLSELDFSSNKLSILPDSFHSLTNLRSLRINNNSFNHLSKSISQLTLLQQLNVSNNFLAQLPSIQKLINLRILNVSFNPISSLALGLISHNQIKILVDQKQMSAIQTQKWSTKSVLFVVDSQDPKRIL